MNEKILKSVERGCQVTKDEIDFDKVYDFDVLVTEMDCKGNIKNVEFLFGSEVPQGNGFNGYESFGEIVELTDDEIIDAYFNNGLNDYLGFSMQVRLNKKQNSILKKAKTIDEIKENNGVVKFIKEDEKLYTYINVEVPHWLTNAVNDYSEFLLSINENEYQELKNQDFLEIIKYFELDKKFYYFEKLNEGNEDNK